MEVEVEVGVELGVGLEILFILMIVLFSSKILLRFSVKQEKRIKVKGKMIKSFIDIILKDKEFFKNLGNLSS